MKNALSTFNFKAKAVLCTCLTLSLHVMTAGCGAARISLPAGLIPITDDSPMTTALGGSALAGAKNIQIDPSGNSFTLLNTESDLQLTGTLDAAVNGEVFVSSMTMTRGSQSATVRFNANKEISQISTTESSSWNRPTGTSYSQPPQAPRAPGRTTLPGLDAYLNANSDVMSVAQQMDQQTLKNSDANFAPLIAVLGALALGPWGAAAAIPTAIGGAVAGIGGVLLYVLQLALGVRLALCGLVGCQ